MRVNRPIPADPFSPFPAAGGRPRWTFPFRFLCLLAAVLLAPAGVRAQRAYWEPGHGALGFGKTSELSLVFEDCSPQGEIPLPTITGLEIGRPSISQQTTINLGQSTSRVVVSYPVQPSGRADIVIPAFDVRTNRGKIAVGEVRFTVGDATVGQSGVSVADILTGLIRPGRTSVWVGEVFDLEYQMLASPRFRPTIATAPDWKPTGLVAEPFGDFEQMEAVVKGERRIGARYRTRVTATAPGPLTIAPIRQTINVQTGERSTFFLSQPRIESFTIASDEPSITVRALPAPAPAGFTGAVGDFQLESRVVPETARVGEPITWTMTLRGTGNWPSNPALPEREVSADFQVVQPQGRRVMDEGRLFTGSLTEDAVLVPTRAGSYTIGPVRFATFDPARGAYREHTIPAVTVTIQPHAAAPSTSPPVDVTRTDGAAQPEDATRPLPDDLPAPAPVLGDPLVPGEDAWAPRHLAWWWWLPIALGTPALVWVGLAWRTMARSDPHRVRTLALRRLQLLLARAQRSGTAPNAATLIEWRRLTARCWMIDRATPTIDDLAEALQRRRGAPRPDDWLTLWREAETAIFAAGQALPPDWVNRAAQAVRSVRLRRDMLPLPLRVRFWAPTTGPVAVGLLLLAWAAPKAHAADAGARAYQEGNFAAARAAWQIEVDREPTDWARRNNLALACAQDGAWAEAAAHWTAAFLLHPRDPAIRSNLRLALSHLDGVDAELHRLVEGSVLDRAITVLSPGEWQFLFFLGAVFVSLGLTLLVVTLYTPRRPRWRTRVGLALVPLGAVAAILSLTAKTLYGPLAEPSAGLVAQATDLRSIPTDLAEHQQTAPISAGAVVVIRQPFALGWDRVDTAGGSGGWLRRATIIPFFRAPPRSAAQAPM